MKNNVCGPGQYSPQKEHVNNPPTWKIGTEARGKVIYENTPGPGNYDPKSDEGQPNYSLAKKLKPSNNSAYYNPGPGTYAPDYNSSPDNRAPSYSLRKKTAVAYKNVNPAPNAYDPSFSQTNVKNPLFSLRGGPVGKRGMEDKRNVPGPGTYVTEKMVGYDNKCHVFGSEKQRVDAKTSAKQAPGPGNYDSDVWFSNEKHRYSKTMGSKLIDNTLTEAKKTPAPGMYDPGNSYTKIKVPSYSIGTQARGKMKPNNNPPPDMYKIRKDVTESPYWSFGSEQRKGLMDRRGFPGPGTYESKPDLGEKPNYSMRQKCEHENKESLGKPGPGTYHPSHSQTHNKSAKFGIGTAKRKPLASKNLNPGPGQYHDTSTLKRGGAKFYSEPRINKMRNHNPGPGMYENRTKIEENLDKIRGYSMGKKVFFRFFFNFLS